MLGLINAFCAGLGTSGFAEFQKKWSKTVCKPKYKKV